MPSIQGGLRMILHGYGRLSLAFFLLSSLPPLFAQSERGTISGTVRDKSGAVIPDAKIAITNTATNIVMNLTTNSVGEYAAPSVQAGTYEVHVEKEGFRPAQINGLTVDASVNARADVTLEVGQSQQMVEVQANAV